MIIRKASVIISARNYAQQILAFLQINKTLLHEQEFTPWHGKRSFPLGSIHLVTTKHDEMWNPLVYTLRSAYHIVAQKRN